MPLRANGNDTDAAVTPLPTQPAVNDLSNSWLLPGTAVVAVPGRPADHAAPSVGPPTDDPHAIDGWPDKDQGPKFPETGTTFLGFNLVSELGRGAFGRVYLAHQSDLSNRPMALKVATDIVGESKTLAQLQHSNIVPIYSFHRTGPLQVVCMPYFGGTTLSQVVQHLGSRASLPSSGRELRSTLNQQSTQAPLSSGSTKPPHPATVPAGPTAVPVAQSTTPPREVDCWTHLEALSFSGAVLWLGEQLADGLAHAHKRGILHRDLKPANVLLADDGRPMLLDFNLAEDTKLRESMGRAAVGGTLPYMAPEQLIAYRDRVGATDERCDIFSLGVILFELLTGRHPYPVRRGLLQSIVTELLTDRQQAPPSARKWNPSVSPAAEAIIRKCLEPDPNKRYQRADHLREDLNRQLHHLPLKFAGNPSVRERVRKWTRRHPKLASSSTVGIVAGVLLCLLGASAFHSWEQTKDLHALTQYTDHRKRFDAVQLFLDDRNQSRPDLDKSMAEVRTVLARYGVSDDLSDDGWAKATDVARLPEADRDRLRGDIGQAFFHLAQLSQLKALGLGDDDPDQKAMLLQCSTRWNEDAERYAGGRLPRAIQEQRAMIAEMRGDQKEGDRLRDEAKRTQSESARDLFLLGATLSQRGEHRAALKHLVQSTLLDPRDFSAWFVRGKVHLELHHNEQAAMCFTACLALRDDFAPAWMNRGLAFSRQRQFPAAIDDYDRAAQLDPKRAETYVQRGDCWAAQNQLDKAEADYTRAIDAGAPLVRLYLMRASVREANHDAAGAMADREKGLKLKPTDELGWIGRAETRLADNPVGALADVERRSRSTRSRCSGCNSSRTSSRSGWTARRKRSRR